jgi:predicted GNAT superfamily acetyltransferase
MTVPGLTDGAVVAAESAARGCRVRVRELREMAELQRVYELYEAIWRPDPANPPITTAFGHALAHAGNYVGGAFDGDALVGACIGFFAEPVGQVLHSHIAGVSPAVRGRSVGFALKTHQRAWALRRGLTTITWTFDPLVARNAYFNLAKLGALPVQYLDDFYGRMGDEINADDESDRLLVAWRLDGPLAARCCAGRPNHADPDALRAAGAAVGLDADEAGGPVAGRVDAPTVLVRLPPDIERLRRSDPAAARPWRRAVRDVLGGLLAEGAAVTGFARDGWYVVER